MMGDRVRVRLPGRHFISICNQPPRSTQPSTLRRTENEYQPKGGDALRLGSRGSYSLFAGKLCVAISERFEKYYSI